MDHDEFKQTVLEQGDAIEAFIKRHDEALEAERKEREALEARLNRGGLSGTNAGTDSKTMDAISSVLRKAAAVSTVTDVTAQMAEETKASAASVGVDPSAGYAVIPDFDNSIRTVARDQGAMRRVANVRRVSSDSYEYLINHGSEASSGWVGEKQSRPDTDTPDLKKGKIEVCEIYSQPKATQKLIDDSAVNIASWLSEEVGLTFGETEASAFIVGDGILKPRGLTTYETEATGDDSRDYGKFEHVLSGKNGAFADSNPADKLVEMVYKLHPGYRRNARFIMSSEVAGAMRKLKTGDGRFLWQDSLQEGEPARLLGFRVEPDEFMPALGSGSLSIAFGDWSRCYQIVDRMGIKVLVDPFTDKPYVKFYTTMRVGGDVVNFNAAKFMKFSAS